jgi:hypothetical protein
MSDLAELFAKPPADLKIPEDIDKIIAHFRDARQRNLIGDKKAGKAPAKPGKIELDDLDI